MVQSKRVRQEEIQVAEMLIQQLRAAGTNPSNPPPPFRAAFQKQVTDGGAFKALTVNTTPQMTYFLGAQRVQDIYR